MLVTPSVMSDVEGMEAILDRGAQDPCWFVENVLGVDTLIWQGHKDILNAFLTNDRVAVKSGHCFCKGTKILMSDGRVKKVEDIEVSELIMGDDSSPRKVLSLSRGQERMYRVTYYDGTEYIHNESHILCLKGMSNHGKMVKDKIIEISIKDFLKLGSHHKRRYAGFRVGVEYEQKSLPIPAYIFGIWLGDGCKTTSDFANIDKEILDELKNYTETIGCEFTNNKNGRNHNISARKKRNPFLGKLRDLGVFNNKCIPDIYMTGSRQQRLELLAGMIDSDGSRHEQGGGYEIIQKRKELAEQIFVLARSLGVFASINEKYVSSDFEDGSHTEGTYYRVYIGRGLCDLPSRLLRKRPLCVSGNRDLNCTAIRSIEDLGIGDYYGFVIDGNQRFLGSDFMVLHNSMGKDFISGVLSLWFLLCHRPSIVITTAPSMRQVSNIVWGEIRKYYHRCRIPIGGKLKQQELRISDDWYAIGFTTKETHNTIGKFQGFKGANILVLATEAQAMEASIFEQMEGILTAENSKLYVAGNPLGTDCYFYQIFRDPSYKHFSFSCYDSPNYIANKTIVPGMVGRKWVEDKEKRWGKNSPLFQGRVLGQFPDLSINSMVSLTQLERSVTNEKPKEGIKVIGLDPARKGNDSTVFYAVDGGKTLEKKQYYGKATNETEDIAFDMIKRIKPKYIIVDEGSFGIAIIDALERYLPEFNKTYNCDTEVITFRFGGRATDRNFANAGTQTYFEVCDKIAKGDIQMAEDYELFNELAARKYEYRKGIMIMEPKEDFKKRIGHSPDSADACVMAFSISMEDTFSEKFEQEQEEIEQEIKMDIDSVTGYRQIYGKIN